MVQYTAATVPLRQLMLDPGNFRFRRPGQATQVAESRIAEEKVQAATLEKVQSDGVSELKRSIAENGFVPVERIVVRAMENGQSTGSADEAVSPQEPQYLVIEGNRRTSALKLLEQDHAGGVDLLAEVVDVFEAVPVLIASDATDDDLLAIMGIRHVGGPKEWGGYQSALLIYQLLSDAGLSAREVASRLGLTVNEVNRRHRAFSALTQMLEDEEYGESVTPEMYPIFHETIGQPIVREWLGWSQSNRRLTNESNRQLFYDWLTAGEQGGKISSYTEIRDLKFILDNEDALTALKDDDQSFADALAIVRADAKAARWFPNTKSALASLNEMGSDTIEGLSSDEVTVLEDIRKRSSWIVRANKMALEEIDEDA
ncbi:hypothetical protein NY546_11175 [Curtobacterium flaccumfaciens pv. flaccumfaciens]|uniref:hypothetical protein n=1 Tax=Curtobacterium flaccumfaciens TaxID=2035 RepID=UPI002659AA56|nr:hypothetical protein [Curtobacterium flaccumfaciens]MCS5509858.1 hypothetical protein [Curtobacterium flaccumfaciens pv. flaccumfaciens]MCX2787319.1 hypothetical protein [Curtobacterium flaccumfaciens pv. flaccumfaciens]